MINVRIVDGTGDGRGLKVNGEGEMPVVVHPHPPRDEDESPDPYRQFFANSAGATDMLVDGSSTSQEFFIQADAVSDIYVKSCSMVISDAGAALNEFGNLAALTNGVDFEWVTQDKGTLTIGSGLKTNFDMVQLSTGQPAFGDGTAAFRASNVSGTSEAYIPHFDFNAIFGMMWGLRLKKGTTDKIVWRINDNVSTMDRFDCVAFGLRF